MSIEAQLGALRSACYVEGQRFKDPYVTIRVIEAWYLALTDVEKREADEVFCCWLKSEEDEYWAIALTFIRELQIKAAIPALDIRAQTFLASDRPGAMDYFNMLRELAKDLKAM